MLRSHPQSIVEFLLHVGDEHGGVHFATTAAPKLVMNHKPCPSRLKMCPTASATQQKGGEKSRKWGQVLIGAVMLVQRRTGLLAFLASKLTS